MELLQKTYSDQRAEYKRVLADALRERDPARMQAYSQNLISINEQMSVTVSSMVKLVARTESRVNVDALRDKLLAELVGIQTDIKSIQDSYGERRVLRSIYDQYSYQNTRNDWTVMAYLVALGIGMLLVVLSVLKITMFSPAALPTSVVPSIPQGLL